MATSSALTLDTERTKLVRKFWESNVAEDDHYTYEIQEKVYINASALNTAPGHGYVSSKEIISKGVLKNVLKAKKWAGDFNGTKFLQLSSEITANLTHD